MTPSESAEPYAPREIYLRGGELLQVVFKIEALLITFDGHIRQRDGKLYDCSSGLPVRATPALLRVRAMQLGSFYKARGRRGHFRAVDPPLKYFEALVRKGEWDFPELESGGAVARNN